TKEAEAVAKEVGKPFKTIFVGGGNPGILGYENLKRILSAAELFGLPEEVTIETNPENVTEEIVTLKPYVNRISMGIQSMKPEVLKTLGRNSTREKNLKALEILSHAGFRWNADIITAVPCETVEDTLSDIREIASYGPEHISYYCLTFEEGTPLISRTEPVGEEKEIEFLTEGWKLLGELGYEHYEISNFARNKGYSIHNKIYWNLGQYIGLGPTAESSLGYSETVSMRNTETIEDFFGKNEFVCERLNREETEETFLMTCLRTSDGIDKAEYESRFGKDFDEVYSDRISLLEENWFYDTKTQFSLTEEGMLRLDSVILFLAMAI
ncbi:MAG: radical SAM protein, partial [Spirochaetales bacterium]|nr:radical SAM protein [Candidatus Physcosoma equi]